MKLSVVGVGPGNPGLITLEGYELIAKTRLLFFPTGGKETLALSIVKKLFSLEDKVLVELHFPMKKGSLYEHWEILVSRIMEFLRIHREGIFLTLGDPAFYCTFYYLFPYLKKQGVEVNFIPGVSSFSAGSSRFAVPLALGEEIVAIIPGERFCEEWERIKFFETIVVLKAKRYLREIVKLGHEEGFQIFIGYRLTQENEVLLPAVEAPLNEREIENFDYFTLAILRRTGRDGE